MTWARPYDTALATFSKGGQARIRRALRRWQNGGTLVGRVIPRNIQSEVFLPARWMKEILSVLRDHCDDDLGNLEEAFQLQCRKAKLKGGGIRVTPLPLVLGRAVVPEHFRDKLFEWYEGSYFDEPADVDELINAVMAGGVVPTAYAKLLMSPHIAWVTWDGDGPFDFLKSDDPDEVRACLGLDPRYAGEPILLLEYVRPGGRLGLYRPTVADAENWPPFDPPIMEERRYGLTRPWPEWVFEKASIDKASLPWVAQARPEAVHRPCAMSLLKGVRRLHK